jgi:hypothetical protein
MNGEPTIGELEEPIAVIRENIAELVEQAAAFSGAGDEARAADRIAEQEHSSGPRSVIRSASVCYAPNFRQIAALCKLKSSAIERTRYRGRRRHGRWPCAWRPVTTLIEL